jgi:hypothetical protein
MLERPKVLHFKTGQPILQKAENRRIKTAIKPTKQRKNQFYKSRINSAYSKIETEHTK